MSDILDYKNTVTSVHTGIVVSLITAPLKPKFSVTTGIGSALLSGFSKTNNAKIVTEALKKSSKSSFKVTVTYTYKQTGSHDGYYYISKIQIA